MSEMSARTRALLERARREAAPSAEELSHLRARLTASLAQQAPDPVLLPFSMSKLAGVLVAAAVGLGAWSLRGALADHDRRVVLAPLPVAAPAPAVSPPVAREATVSCPPVPACDPPAAKPAQVKLVACAPAASADDADAARERAARRGQQHDLFSVAAAQKDASLELQLLILARVALDEDRAMDALGHTLKHEDLYPHSAFEEERLAIQVLAYCAAENPEQAARRFERLMELSPQTTYLPRIKGTCGEDFVQR